MKKSNGQILAISEVSSLSTSLMYCNFCSVIGFSWHSLFILKISSTNHVNNCWWIFILSDIIVYNMYRFSRKIQRPSRTMVSGWGTRVEPATITCTRSTGIPLWTVLWNRCTLRWLLATGFVTIASRSLRQPPSQQNYARGKVLSSSTTLRSSSRWYPRRSGHLVGSWRLLIRHPDLTCLCNKFEICYQLWDIFGLKHVRQC